MMAKPRQEFNRGLRDDRQGLFDPASIKEIPGDSTLAGDMFIECEIEHPPSQKGRTVTVHVPAEQVVALMKGARRAAERARSRSMS